MHLQKTFSGRKRKDRGKSGDRVELPEDLADTTILVLGLMEMGYTDIERIVDILRLQERRSLRKLLRMLKTSRNPVVRQCVDVGLPPGLCRPFPYEGIKVLCPVCHSMVDHAPCPHCSLVVAGRCAPERPRKERPLDGAPTKALPGTWRKVQIMRRRAEEGLSVFHPRDPNFLN